MFKAFRDLFLTGGILVHGNHNVVTHNTNSVAPGGPRDRLLERASSSAIHDSKEVANQEMCLEHTREAILELLGDYLAASELESPGLLWLNGAAGVGKSAIARTIAHSASETGTLLASFFFYSSDATRNTLDPLVPTLAAQIYRIYPQARPYIERAIDDDPFIFTKATSAQADALIVQPLVHVLQKRSGPNATPLSIVVDGLDECADSERQSEAVDVLLGVIAKVHAAAAVRLKVVLFSRPERWIRDRVAQSEQVGQVISVVLDGDLNPRSDIKLYYTTHFAKIRKDHSAGPFLEDDWPGCQKMDKLVEITDDHFAFAHTMRIFVADPNEDPTEQLEIVLGIAQPNRASPHTHIDKLFATILSRIPPHLLPKALRIIGAILVPSVYALNPSPQLLELVFSLRRGEIQRIFSHLESLFYVGNRISSWIRVYHKTLADFLFTPSRSKEYGLFIDQDAACEDIHQSIRSTLLLQEVPEREGLAALVQFLRRLRKSPLDPSQSKFGQTRNVPPPSMWQPWAFIIGSQYRDLPILKSLAVPSRAEYAQQISMKDGSKDISKALSVYTNSAFGKIALVLSTLGFWEVYDEGEEAIFQAFIRHAIRSQPGLAELDRTVGWNLVACEPNDLAEAAICAFACLSFSDLAKEVAYDALDSNWGISRLGMLLSWHESGHKSTDDPWQYAARGEVIEVASKPRCLICLEVLEICKAQILAQCLWWIEPESAFYHNLLDHVQAHPLLWNNFELLYTWKHEAQIRQ